MRGRTKASFSFRILPPLGNANVNGLFGAVSALERFSPSCVGVAGRHDRCICGRLRNKLVRHVHAHHHPKAVTMTTTVRDRCNVPIIPRVLYDNCAHRSARCVLLSLRFLNVDSLLILQNSGTGRSPVFQPAKSNCVRTARLLRRVGHFGSKFFSSKAPVTIPKTPFSYKITYCPRGRSRTPGPRTSLSILGGGTTLKTGCTIARLFCSGHGCFSFIAHTHRTNVRVPVVPNVGPLSGVSRVSMIPGAFRYSLPRRLTIRLGGYRASRRIGTIKRR